MEKKIIKICSNKTGIRCNLRPEKLPIIILHIYGNKASSRQVVVHGKAFLHPAGNPSDFEELGKYED